MQFCFWRNNAVGRSRALTPALSLRKGGAKKRFRQYRKFGE
jgi:hypothetical protein